MVCTVVMSGLYSVAKYTPSATLSDCRTVHYVLTSAVDNQTQRQCDLCVVYSGDVWFIQCGQAHTFGYTDSLQSCASCTVDDYTQGACPCGLCGVYCGDVWFIQYGQVHTFSYTDSLIAILSLVYHIIYGACQDN